MDAKQFQYLKFNSFIQQSICKDSEKYNFKDSGYANFSFILLYYIENDILEISNPTIKSTLIQLLVKGIYRRDFSDFILERSLKEQEILINKFKKTHDKYLLQFLFNAMRLVNRNIDFSAQINLLESNIIKIINIEANKHFKNTFFFSFLIYFKNFLDTSLKEDAIYSLWLHYRKSILISGAGSISPRPSSENKEDLVNRIIKYFKFNAKNPSEISERLNFFVGFTSFIFEEIVCIFLKNETPPTGLLEEIYDLEKYTSSTIPSERSKALFQKILPYFFVSGVASLIKAKVGSTTPIKDRTTKKRQFKESKGYIHYLRIGSPFIGEAEVERKEDLDFIFMDCSSLNVGTQRGLSLKMWSALSFQFSHFFDEIYITQKSESEGLSIDYCSDFLKHCAWLIGQVMKKSHHTLFECLIVLQLELSILFNWEIGSKKSSNLIVRLNTNLKNYINRIKEHPFLVFPVVGRDGSLNKEHAKICIENFCLFISDFALKGVFPWSYRGPNEKSGILSSSFEYIKTDLNDFNPEKISYYLGETPYDKKEESTNFSVLLRNGDIAARTVEFLLRGSKPNSQYFRDNESLKPFNEIQFQPSSEILSILIADPRRRDSKERKDGYLKVVPFTGESDWYNPRKEPYYLKTNTIKRSTSWVPFDGITELFRDSADSKIYLGILMNLKKMDLHNEKYLFTINANTLEGWWKGNNARDRFDAFKEREDSLGHKWQWMKNRNLASLQEKVMANRKGASRVFSEIFAGISFSSLVGLYIGDISDLSSRPREKAIQQQVGANGLSLLLTVANFLRSQLGKSIGIYEHHPTIGFTPISEDSDNESLATQKIQERISRLLSL